MQGNVIAGLMNCHHYSKEANEACCKQSRLVSLTESPKGRTMVHVTDSILRLTLYVYTRSIWATLHTRRAMSMQAASCDVSQLLMGAGNASCPDADITKTVKTLMSKVPSAAPDARPKRFAFAKELRNVFGISDSVHCRTLRRRIKELAGTEIPTIRLVEERARGGSGRTVVLPNAILPGQRGFAALKVDAQYMKLLQAGLKYGLRSSHKCRHKCVCGRDCSLHPRHGMLSGAMELKMVGWTASALRGNWDRQEMSPLEAARRENQDVIKVLKDMGVDGIKFDAEHPLIIPMFTAEKNEDGWLGGFLFVDNFVSVDYVATNLKGEFSSLILVSVSDSVDRTKVSPHALPLQEDWEICNGI